MKNKTLPWIIGFLILIGIAAAVPLNPEIYWGFVYVEGQLAQNGSVLSVETINGELLANQTLPEDPAYFGSYYIEIPFDNPATSSKDEGADYGEHLNWYLNGILTIDPAAGQDTAEAGKTNNNFTITAVANPNITVESINYSNQSIFLGDWINLTVILNNSGDGTANVTLVNLTPSDNLTADLPKTLQVPVNNLSETSLNITPAACGEFNPDLNINYYNLAGNLIDSIAAPLNFNVTGHDIEIINVTANDYYFRVGLEITVGAILTNKGNYPINGFNITFYEGCPNGTELNSVDTNLTLNPGENTSVTFNWQPALGTHIVTAVVNITSAECNLNNNIMNSSTITVTSSSGGGSGGSSSESESNEQNITVVQKEEEEEVKKYISGFSFKNTTKNETNISKQGITGMASRGPATVVIEKLPPYLLIIMIVIAITLFVYRRQQRTEKIEMQKPKEIKKPVISSPYKTRIENSPRLGLFKEMNKPQLNPMQAAQPHQKSKVEKPKQENKIHPNVKITPRRAVFDRPIDVMKMKSKPIEIKPKVKVNRDALIGNVMMKIKEIVRKGENKLKKLNTIIAAPQKTESNNVPYEHLAQAVELVEKITKDKKPRDILIAKYGRFYPRYLIDMVGKYVYLNEGFNKEIDVIEELNKLELLDQDYSEISKAKLVKAVDIIAKGYAKK